MYVLYIFPHDIVTLNKPPLKRGKVGIPFSMKKTRKGYSHCTPIMWWFVTCHQICISFTVGSIDEESFFFFLNYL